RVARVVEVAAGAGGLGSPLGAVVDDVDPRRTGRHADPVDAAAVAEVVRRGLAVGALLPHVGLLRREDSGPAVRVPPVSAAVGGGGAPSRAVGRARRAGHEGQAHEGDGEGGGRTRQRTPGTGVHRITSLREWTDGWRRVFMLGPLWGRRARPSRLAAARDV